MSPLKPETVDAAMPSRPEKLMNAAEVAELLGVPEPHIYRLSREGKLPTIKVGRYSRSSPSALAAFMANGGTTGAGR